MSATPMKFNRDPLLFQGWRILQTDDGTVVRILGPSRESVAQKILAMEKVVEVLRTMLSYEDDDDEHWQITEARSALAAWEGKT